MCALWVSVVATVSGVGEYTICICYNLYGRSFGAHSADVSKGAFCTEAAATEFIEYIIINRIYNLMHFTFSTHCKTILARVNNFIYFL